MLFCTEEFPYTVIRALGVWYCLHAENKPGIFRLGFGFCFLFSNLTSMTLARWRALEIPYILTWIQHLSLSLFFQCYLTLWGQIEIKFKLVWERRPEQLSVWLKQIIVHGPNANAIFSLLQHLYDKLATIQILCGTEAMLYHLVRAVKETGVWEDMQSRFLIHFFGFWLRNA